jgi:hypothetical protein
METLKCSRLLNKSDIDKMQTLNSICEEHSIDITFRIAQTQLHKSDVWWDKNINKWCVHNMRIRQCDECYAAFLKALVDVQ